MGLQDLDDMIPWERDVYIELIKPHVEEENRKIREAQNARTAGRNQPPRF